MATAKTAAPGLIEITRKRPPARLPEKVGSLLDLRWNLKLQKEALEAALRDVNKDIGLLEDAIYLRFNKEGALEGARGKLCQASISRSIIPIAEDWQTIFQFIKKGRGLERFSLLQKRLGVTAVREFQDEGIKIPGVGSFEKKSLSLTKVK